jgi:hypothetical protein
MNEVPPNQDPSDDIDDHYRRASALDPSRPSESVRRAVLAHATTLAEERAAKKHPTKTDSPRPSTHHAWWRPAIFGTLAAAALAGLLITPQFLAPRAPPVAAIPPIQISRSETAATPAARAPALKPSPDTLADEQPPPPALAEAQSAAKHRVSAREAAPQAIESYARPNENSAAADAPAENSRAGAMAPAARSRAEAIAPRTPLTYSTDSAISAAPPPAGRMLQAGRPTDSPTALRRAAEIGDLPGLQAALDEHVDINARDASGRTALMLAILHGRAAAVDTLLAYGADPNSADARGTTPLQAAVAGDQQAIVAALKRAGAR